MQRLIANKNTGVIRWLDGDRSNGETEVVEMSPEHLGQLIAASDREANEAKMERVGFVSLMSRTELQEARLNRDRQTVIYPDTKVETEESRARGMRILHANKRKESKVVEPIVNKGTGIVTFPKPEAKKAAAPAEDMAYVAIPKAAMNQLVSLAHKDGFKADAETDRGKANQASKAARTYVLLAIDMLVAKRAG